MIEFSNYRFLPHDSVLKVKLTDKDGFVYGHILWADDEVHGDSSATERRDPPVTFREIKNISQYLNDPLLYNYRDGFNYLQLDPHHVESIQIINIFDLV